LLGEKGINRILSVDPFFLFKR